jgi:membrane protease YdiL (CAAX protease family)
MIDNKKGIGIWLAVGMSCIFLLAVAMGGLISMLFMFLGTNPTMLEVAMLIQGVFQYGVTIGICCIIMRKISGRISINFSLPYAKIIPLTILVSLALTWGIVNPIVELIPMPKLIEELLMKFQNSTGIAMFLYMVILGPIGEELIFRGFILEGLLDRYSARKAILFSALLFGIVHLNPWQFIPGFILGIFFGWVYYNTQRSIIQAIILHAIVNLSGYITHFFPDEFGIGTSYFDLFGSNLNYVLFITGTVIIAGLCIWLLQRIFYKAKKIEKTNEKIIEA